MQHRARVALAIVLHLGIGRQRFVELEFLAQVPGDPTGSLEMFGGYDIAR